MDENYHLELPTYFPTFTYFTTSALFPFSVFIFFFSSISISSKTTCFVQPIIHTQTRFISRHPYDLTRAATRLDD